jgi:uncharacterized flavoprotein (TIGR03862 family)
MTSNACAQPRVAIVGGGPAGLMAAEVLAAHSIRVDLFDAMPSVGRKFLLAGVGGLNLTHGEPLERFIARYADRRVALEPMLRGFGPSELRAWAEVLGVPTFVGSSGRVFPRDLKAAPLLRAWLHRLRESGVAFHTRHRWIGWADSAATAAPGLRFEAPEGEVRVEADAVLLALGGGSWPRLGSNGAWMSLLAARGAAVVPLRPSNCGFEVAHPDVDGTRLPGWSEFFRARHAGEALKNVALSLVDAQGRAIRQAGEFVITERGIEGSLVYALSAPARDLVEAKGSAQVHIDLLPGRSPDHVRAEVERPRGSRSLSTHLKSRLGLGGVKAALLRELLSPAVLADPTALAPSIKALPLTLTAPRPLDEAISSAGGVSFEGLDDALMLRDVPGVYCAGEMLDWEAPTGGYLLTASFATGRWAAIGLANRLAPSPA